MKLGIFDSGLGGLIITRAIRKVIPDIDILYYGDMIDVDKNIPRGEITKFDFVLRPLYDLQPGHRHPVIMKTHYTMINDMRLQKMIIRQIDTSLLE